VSVHRQKKTEGHSVYLSISLSLRAWYVHGMFAIPQSYCWRTRYSADVLARFCCASILSNFLHILRVFYSFLFHVILLVP
jgi:hypothetical protein